LDFIVLEVLVRFYKVFIVLLVFLVLSGGVFHGVEEFENFAVERYVKSESNPAKAIFDSEEARENIWKDGNPELVLVMASTVKNIRLYCQAANIFLQVFLCLIFAIFIRRKEV
jgi:hypothetical protein